MVQPEFVFLQHRLGFCVVAPCIPIYRLHRNDARQRGCSAGVWPVWDVYIILYEIICKFIYAIFPTQVASRPTDALLLLLKYDRHCDNAVLYGNENIFRHHSSCFFSYANGRLLFFGAPLYLPVVVIILSYKFMRLPAR